MTMTMTMLMGLHSKPLVNLTGVPFKTGFNHL
jgi:hypothetical protein